MQAGEIDESSLNPCQADQQIRDVTLLPKGLGKTVRVLVFAQGEATFAAQAAGADFVAETDEDLELLRQTSVAARQQKSSVI